MGTANDSSGPVDEAYKAQMSAIMHAIDDFLNPDKESRNVGFALLMFPFGEKPNGRINYMSNGCREDMISALKELVANFESRVLKEPDVKQ